MPNWQRISFLPFLNRLKIYLVIGAVIFVVFCLFILYFSNQSVKLTKPQNNPDVSLPTIINGELVLPSKTDSSTNLSKVISNGRIVVNSANLVAIFDQDKLSGLRIVGEITNVGDSYINDISPVVKFFDVDGNSVGQKIAHTSGSFSFLDIGAKVKTLYDVTVDKPPVSEKVEIIFNSVSSSTSAIFDELKIASRSLETKTTIMNPQASESAAKSVDYYLAIGKIVNPLEVPVSNVVVYAWARNDQGKVFAVGQTEFKNDLIAPGQGVDFSVMVLPLLNDQTMASYEIAAWGKEYKLNF